MSIASAALRLLCLLTLLVPLLGLVQAQPVVNIRVGAEPLGEVPALAASGFNYGNSMLVVGSEAEYEAIRVDSLRFPPGNQADEITVGEADLAALELNRRLLGGPPVLMVANLFGGSPQQAADLARLTREKGIPVLAWEIGNEPDLYASNRGDPSWTPERYCTEFRRFREALHQVDPGYLLAGPAVSGARPGGEEYLREVLLLCGDVIDILTWHIYPTDGTWEDGPALATSSQFSDEYRRYRAWVHDPATNPLGWERQLELGVTEFGLSWRSSSYRHLEDMTATLWLADLLGRMTSERLYLSSYFTLQGMGGHGLIGTGGWVRPTYHLYRMLAPFTGAVLPVTAEPPLTAYATRNDSVRVLLVNRSTTEVRARLAFETVATGELQVTTLSATIFDELLEPVTSGSRQPTHPRSRPGRRARSGDGSRVGASMTESGEERQPSFIWGVATSAFQIEGATAEDGRGASIWDSFCRMPGKVAGGATGEIACDHYHRWQEDLDLVAELGVDAYRFSIAWPRILPHGDGRVEPRGLDFYDRLVDGLLERGLLPFATLYHWDLPQALEEAGGWPNRDTAYAFAEYADVVTERLGDRVHSWATLNEPWCSAHLGYVAGEHAPGRTSRRDGLQAAHNLLLAHGLALPLMRRNAPRASHGIVLNLNPAYPATDSEQDRAAAKRYDGFFNRWYLDPLLRGEYPSDVWRGYGEDVPEVEPGDLAVISAPLDFLGVNFYSRALVSHGEGEWPAVSWAAPHGSVTEMGWEVFPQALTDLLLRLGSEYAAPDLFVTENGAAYPDKLARGSVDDVERIEYLAGHIEAVEEAITAGARVKGYFAWSLMDNFEWAHGYGKRFGLIHVDYDTQARTLKESAKWYRGRVGRAEAEPVK